MNLRSLALLTGCLLGATAMAASAAEPKPAAAPATPATQPVKVAAAAATVADDLTGVALATRAQMTFNRGEYATALPLLKKMTTEADVAGNPSKLGPIQERIRVCEKALAAA